MADPFLAEIRAVAFSFAPRGWFPCDGRLLPISQYTALFALLGTTYGGNGQTNFGLPDLRGRTMLGNGQGPGLSPYVLGEEVGAPTSTLLITEMPAHVHLPAAAVDVGNANMHSTPQAGDQLTRFAPGPTGLALAWNTPPIDNPVLMDPMFVQPAGGSQPHNNMQPYLTLLYCIAYEGIFPARN